MAQFLPGIPEASYSQFRNKYIAWLDNTSIQQKKVNDLVHDSQVLFQKAKDYKPTSRLMLSQIVEKKVELFDKLEKARNEWAPLKFLYLLFNKTNNEKDLSNKLEYLSKLEMEFESVNEDIIKEEVEELLSISQEEFKEMSKEKLLKFHNRNFINLITIHINKFSMDQLFNLRQKIVFMIVVTDTNNKQLRELPDLLDAKINIILKANEEVQKSVNRLRNLLNAISPDLDNAELISKFNENANNEEFRKQIEEFIKKNGKIIFPNLNKYKIDKNKAIDIQLNEVKGFIEEIKNKINNNNNMLKEYKDNPAKNVIEQIIKLKNQEFEDILKGLKKDRDRINMQKEELNKQNRPKMRTLFGGKDSPPSK